MEENFSEFSEFDKSLMHELGGGGQFKDPLCYLCLHDTVVSSLSRTQEVMGSSYYFNRILSLNSLKLFMENSIRNDQSVFCRAKTLFIKFAKV